MNRLYCPDCGNYLMGSDGDCHNCHCGWMQPLSQDSELQSKIAALEFEIDQLRQQNKDLYLDAKRYQWIKHNISEEVYQRPDEYVGVKTKYVLPFLMAYAEFCGQISLDQAIDFKLEDQNKGDTN